jgi:hypothetical protein
MSHSTGTAMCISVIETKYVRAVAGTCLADTLNAVLQLG